MKRTKKTSTKKSRPNSRKTRKAPKTRRKSAKGNGAQRNARKTPTGKRIVPVLPQTQPAAKGPKLGPQPVAPKSSKKTTDWDTNGGKITLTDTIGVHLRLAKNELKVGDTVRVKVGSKVKPFELIVKHVIAKKDGSYTVMAFCVKGTGREFGTHRLQAAIVSW